MQDFIMPFLWLLAGLLGLWKQLSDLRNNDKGTDGSVSKQISEAWNTLNAPLLAQIKKMEDKISEMESERERHLRFIGELIRGAKIHIEQLEGAEMKSNWIPSEELLPLYNEIINALAIGDSAPAHPLTQPRQNHSGLGRKQ